eukprot:2659968-Prymnesium_polylepis.1
MVHFELGERKLEFYALQNSFSVRINPAQCLLHCKQSGGTEDLLNDSPPPWATFARDARCRSPARGRGH